MISKHFNFKFAPEWVTTDHRVSFFCSPLDGGRKQHQTKKEQSVTKCFTLWPWLYSAICSTGKNGRGISNRAWEKALKKVWIICKRIWYFQWNCLVSPLMGKHTTVLSLYFKYKLNLRLKQSSINCCLRLSVVGRNEYKTIWYNINWMATFGLVCENSTQKLQRQPNRQITYIYKKFELNRSKFNNPFSKWHSDTKTIHTYNTRIHCTIL